MYSWPLSLQPSRLPTSQDASRRPPLGFVDPRFSSSTANSPVRYLSTNSTIPFMPHALSTAAQTTGISTPLVEDSSLSTVPDQDDALSWQIKLSHLAKYKEQHGSTNVPNDYPILGQWVRDIRLKYELMHRPHGTIPPSRPPLTPAQIASLNSVGFEWTMEPEGSENDNAQAWEDRFRALCKFKTDFGHCMVPARYPADRQLGHWVMTQRRQYHLMMKGRPSSMIRDRIEKLNSLGFVWSVRTDHDEMWNLRFEELKVFKEKHGDCLVPQRYPPNPQLGTWVNTQRRHYKLMKDNKHSSMTEDRVRALEALGFVWVTSRGAPPLKKRPGKQEAREVVDKKQKLDAYDIAARRFPVGESPFNQLRPFPDNVAKGSVIQEATGISPNPNVIQAHANRDPSSRFKSTGLPSAAIEQSTKKQQSRWICDVCHVATFNSFEDAYAHESICTGMGVAMSDGG